MEAARLLISICHANCPRCGLPTEFRMFESGAGGNFDTYIGEATGSIYRMDLGKIHYQGLSADVLLADAQKKEGRLARIPKEIRCKICSTVFSAQTIPIDREEVIDAYEL